MSRFEIVSQTERPRIGIAPSRVIDAMGRPLLGARRGYHEALSAAGALVFLIASVEPADASRYLGELDGLLLPGGGDIPPSHYGETPEPGLELIDDDVARMQLALARAALHARLPTLGICLGCQVMNVACGGTLFQDLARDAPSSPVPHSGAAGADALHEVVVVPRSRLFAATGESRLVVVSQHHQAVRDLGRGLKATAEAPDKVIEAIEHADAPFYVGVQWHPERGSDNVASRRLLGAFVGAALQHRAARGALRG